MNKIEEIKTLLDDPFPGVDLTPAERECIKLAALGHKFSAIAETRDCSIDTVKALMGRANKKLGTQTADLPRLVIEKIAQIVGG